MITHKEINTKNSLNFLNHITVKETRQKIQDDNQRTEWD